MPWQRCARIVQGMLDEDALLARIGGEEFAILVPNRSSSEANAMIERVRAAIAESRIVAGPHALTMTVSMGLCSAPRGGAALEPLLRRADAGLYSAKRSGRDRVIAAV